MNDENLIPNEHRTPSERRENAKNAGVASGKARRKKSQFKKLVLSALAMRRGKDTGDGQGAVLHTLEEIGAANLAAKFADGDLKAIELVLGIVGEPPSKSVEVTGKGGTPLVPEPRGYNLDVLTTEEREALLRIGTNLINRKE